MDPSCKTGSGDPDDVSRQEENICRNDPTSGIGNSIFSSTTLQLQELPCLFPFYIDDIRIESCIQNDVQGLGDPVFRCPVRNVTTKYPGTNINQFSSKDFTNFFTVELCPDFESWNRDEEEMPPLNPNKKDCELVDLLLGLLTNITGENFPDSLASDVRNFTSNPANIQVALNNINSFLQDYNQRQNEENETPPTVIINETITFPPFPDTFPTFPDPGPPTLSPIIINPTPNITINPNITEIFNISLPDIQNFRGRQITFAQCKSNCPGGTKIC